MSLKELRAAHASARKERAAFQDRRKAGALSDLDKLQARAELRRLTGQLADAADRLDAARREFEPPAAPAAAPAPAGDAAPRLGFVVAGVQKGGTTALHRQLRIHPQIGMPIGKESKFFFSEARNWSAPDYGELQQEYLPRPGVVLLGQATPNTIYTPRVLDRLRQYDPGLKIIVLFRDPVARAFSHWKMNRYRNVEPLSFGEAVRAGRERLHVGRNPRRAVERYSYVERGLYAAQIDALLQRFPREQTLFLETEQLRGEAPGALGRIAALLGVANTWPEPRRERPSLSGDVDERLDPADAAYLREVFAPDHARFVEITGLGKDWLA